MGYDKIVTDLISKADIAGEEGRTDDEIQFRINAFFKSEGMAQSPVEQIEKAIEILEISESGI